MEYFADNSVAQRTICGVAVQTTPTPNAANKIELKWPSQFL